MKVWVVGRSHRDSWELRGIYTSEYSAEDRCALDTDFVGPVNVDEDLPEEIVDWPGLRYPLASVENTYVARKAPVKEKKRGWWASWYEFLD